MISQSELFANCVKLAVLCSVMAKSDLETEVNEALIQNGWDYDDRKRVLFMLRNRKPRQRTEQECIDAIYKRYGTNLTAFFADAHAEVKANAERRRLGGV